MRELWAYTVAVSIGATIGAVSCVAVMRLMGTPVHSGTVGAVAGLCGGLAAAIAGRGAAETSEAGEDAEPEWDPESEWNAVEGSDPDAGPAPGPTDRGGFL